MQNGKRAEVSGPSTLRLLQQAMLKSLETFRSIRPIGLQNRLCFSLTFIPLLEQPSRLRIIQRSGVLQALLMAVWRRKPRHKVLIHTDQGSQYTSRDWAAFLRAHHLEHSMSRRGNCHDNAVAESFFNLLKRERIRRRSYKTRQDARRDIFDYIEMFYNPKRKHVRNGMLSPVDFENRQQKINEGV